MYSAKHHVTLSGRHYLPGEVIDGPVPKWWLSVGAVEQVDDGSGDGIIPPPEIDTAAFEPEEIDQEAEPEEIDVSAGVIPASAPAKPKKAARMNGGK